MRSRSASTEAVSRRCLFCLNSEFSNLKSREYVPQYNPLRLFHVAASELSKPCQTFVAVCFHLSTDRDISRKVLALSEKNLAESRKIFPLLAMPTSIASIFFRRTHLPFTWLPRSNAYWFSGRLLTHSLCISNLLRQEKNSFSYFYTCMYLQYLFSSSSFSLFLSFFFQQSNIYEYWKLYNQTVSRGFHTFASSALKYMRF